MECVICQKLEAQFGSLERAYAEVVGKFTAARGTTDASEYEQLRISASNARIDSEMARLQLEQHRRAHQKAH